MIYNAITNELNLPFFFFTFAIFYLVFSSMSVGKFVCRREKTLEQLFLGFTECVCGGGSQNVGTVDTLTKTVL